MVDDQESTDLVPVEGSISEDSATRLHEDLILRAHITSKLTMLAVGPAEEMELLARIDAGLRQAALATGGNGRQIREAWQAGVNAFLREP